MPQFDPSTFTSQIFWLLVSFGIVIGAFVFLFVPKINALLENRSKKIRQDLERAQILNQQIEKLLRSREERVRLSEEKAAAIIQETLTEMEGKKTKQYKIVEAELAQTIHSLQESIERQKQTLQTSLKPLVNECVQLILPKLIGSYQETKAAEKSGKKKI
jgi:F-type H+-transporting ATPase subunit b